MSIEAVYIKYITGLYYTSLSTSVLLASLNVNDHSSYIYSGNSRQATHNVLRPNWAYCSTASEKVLICCPENFQEQCQAVSVNMSTTENHPNIKGKETVYIKHQADSTLIKYRTKYDCL